MLTEKSKALCLTPGITTLLSFGIGWSGAAINLCPGQPPFCIRIPKMRKNSVYQVLTLRCIG